MPVKNMGGHQRGPRLAYTVTMKTRISLATALLAVVLCLPTLQARAQEDSSAYNSAVFLFTQTTRPYRDGRHNSLLLALRHLKDPQLAPLFDALTVSEYPAQRIHGQIGLAEASLAGKLDLAALAETPDPRELIELIGIAMDNDLLTPADLSQVMRWEVLDNAARQALAVRIVAAGGVVDHAVLRDTLLAGEAAVTRSSMLQHGLAALLLSEAGDPSAADELAKLNRLGEQGPRDLARAKILDVALQHEFATLAPWAFEIAQDPGTDAALRLSALRVALRFPDPSAPGRAAALWRSWFEDEADAAQRIRLALIALEAAPWAAPDLYRPLETSGDDLFVAIGAAGSAIATNSPSIAEAVVALVGHGHPTTIQWAVGYANGHASESARGLILTHVIQGAIEGSPSYPGGTHRVRHPRCPVPRHVGFGITTRLAAPPARNRGRRIPAWRIGDTPHRLAWHGPG